MKCSLYLFPYPELHSHSVFILFITYSPFISKLYYFLSSSKIIFFPTVLNYFPHHFLFTLLFPIFPSVLKFISDPLVLFPCLQQLQFFSFYFSHLIYWFLPLKFALKSALLLPRVIPIFLSSYLFFFYYSHFSSKKPFIFY